MIEYELPRNAVEQRHVEYLVSKGVDPAEFLIDAQLARWELQHGAALSDAEEAILRRLSAEAPSRFELAHRLHLYDIVKTNIRTMQAMSRDRQGFPDERFVIATEPEGYTASARTHWHPPICSAQEASDRPQLDHDSVIWMPMDGRRLAGDAANLVAARLVPQFGSLYHLLEALTLNVGWTEVLALLRPPGLTLDGPPGPAAPGRRAIGFVRLKAPPGESAATEQLLDVALLTFEAGHEAGHIYHGHTGLWPATTAFRRLSRSIPAPWADEASADTVGIAAVWDGMRAHQQISIDLSWVGPILSLACCAGITAAYPSADAEMEEEYQHWLFRLACALRAIAANLRGNHFEVERSAQILAAAAPLVAAVYEYWRCGGDLPSESPTLGISGSALYASLATVCIELLESLI